MNKHVADPWSAFKFQAVIQGKHAISKDPTVAFSTILGSCITVCLHDPRLKLGGMNHFLLPGTSRETGDTNRYGAFAMEMLINALLRAGASRSDLRAKMVGGASMYVSSDDIGKRNAAFTDSYLKAEGIACDVRDVGGDQARRLHFHPASGRLRVLRLPRTEAAEVAKKEVAAVPKPPAAKSDITLF